MKTKTYGLGTLLDRTSYNIDSNNFDISINDFDDVEINNLTKNSKYILKNVNGSWSTYEINNNDDITKYATISNVDQVITDLIGNVPDEFNTLGEFSSLLNSDYSIIDDLNYRIENNRQIIFRGDGISRIFDVPNHKSGYISVNLDGIELINRVLNYNDVNGLTNLNIDEYDYYSGVGIVAYRSSDEYIIQETNKDLYKYENGEGLSYFGPGDIWGIKKNQLGEQLPIGEIFSYGEDLDYIWSAGTNFNDSYYSPTLQIGGRSEDYNLNTSNNSNFYYYKLEQFSAPNPLDAEKICNKLYFLEPPPNDSFIFIRIYF